MAQTLELVRVVALFVFGVALAATLHGLLSMQPSGWMFMWIALLLVILATIALPEDLRFYALLTAVAIALGIGLWEKDWTAFTPANSEAQAKSVCSRQGRLKSLEQVEGGYVCTID